MELNQFRTIANGWDIPDQLAKDFETQLIFVGHSFGGLITYNALYSEILERGLQVDKADRYQMAKSLATLSCWSTLPSRAQRTSRSGRPPSRAAAIRPGKSR